MTEDKSAPPNWFETKGRHWQYSPPLKTAFAVTTVVFTIIVVAAFMQFRGDFTPMTQLTLISQRAGLVMDPGSKVTYNGVQIGRVTGVDPIERDGTTKAKLSLDVEPKYIPLIPANAIAEVKASTVFGNKYVSFRSPPNPTPQRISSKDVLDVSHVTTEFNTLFETLTSISEKVDPVKLNLTLSAAAEALDGLGTKFGQSIVNGNAVLDDVNPQMPQIRTNIQQLSKLADVYTKASPDLWDFLDHAVTTARTLNEQQKDLDAALLASTGFGNTGADIFERGGPYFVRGQADLIPTAKLLDTYSPAIMCTIRNYATSNAKDSAGGNGYSIDFHIGLTGAPNPYVYPDNLPRVNAKGGPGGAPGCWQEVNRNFWPAPFLVADYGASLAPYNHFELGQPLLTEYVWGRQVGENTINP
ncbi:phospholipid/cholesterol/gamma-HCH transport system substrate-binding protein [Mycolicibacterium sp. BK634]|uniref:MCE family protein n=1 Tax=Mycobacteriaceae TaxID=1762 RepID=UPI00105EE2FB|nr:MULTISPECIES: MCE family protein [Mycobacteriaceae]MBB3748686.1 phospholipid/cholesterol/gamma-HCH transport system substrate-binding protein [Mycolicibacterium sp. BK634]TDO15123.1 phospholipid/cholesterol/gamma-HCH transport system substrate-binding protein [Mycobacterium sp. BK086]